MSGASLARYLPETPDDAIASGDLEDFIPAAVWSRCFDPTLPVLQPGDRAPLVLGVDLALSGDTAAVVAVSRHPKHHQMVAVRAVRIWTPRGGTIPLTEIEDFIRLISSGGCRDGHPKSTPKADCEFCQRSQWEIPPHNVVCMVYDPFQAALMAERLREEIWVEEFSQMARREEADVKMQQLALRGELRHHGDPALDEHVLNAVLRISSDGHRGRIAKRSDRRKVDAAVATSMAVSQCLRLNL